MPQTIVLVFREAAVVRVADTHFRKWLDEVRKREPKAYAKCLQRIILLGALGNELRRPLSDGLRDGIRELRAKRGRVNYRILYFFCGKDVACLSHGITKEGEVPDSEIDLAIQRKKLVESNPARFTVEWEVRHG
jgi:hypothetical protein